MKTTDGQIQLGEALHGLAADPRHIHPQRIWKSMTAGVRKEAAYVMLRDSAAHVESHDLRIDLAKSANFRESTVLGWPVDRVADLCGRTTRIYPKLIWHLLLNLHLKARLELLTTYLDLIGIEHDEGTPRAVQTSPLLPTPSDAEAAGRQILGSFPPDQVILYLVTLHQYSPGLVPESTKWLPKLIADLSEKSVGPGVVDATQDVAGRDDPEPAVEDTETFTTLDRQLIRAAVDAVQGVDGALNVDELEDLLEEVLHLNSSRHATYFHLGFFDILLDREPRDLAVVNKPRERWFWSGVLTGLARRSDWVGITALYDTNETVRVLGQGSDPQSSRSAPLLFDALTDQDRIAEATEAVGMSALIRVGPPLMTKLLDVGIKLIREQRSDEVRLLLSKLLDAMAIFSEQGFSLPDGLSLEARRRYAHCLREAGEREAAKKTLLELLEDEEDPGVCSMIQTDLGLIEGRFKNLAAVHLPHEKGHVTALIHSLKKGSVWFDKASRPDHLLAGHAHYCLGMLRFSEGDWKTAEPHLLKGLTTFEARPDSYRAGGLLARARLLAALVLSRQLEPQVMARVKKLVRQSCAEEITPPGYLLRDFLDACEMCDGKQAVEIVDLLLGCWAPEDDRVDILCASAPGQRSERVISRLVDRARLVTQPRTRRSLDLERVIPLLIREGRHDDAEEALDKLEELAIQGVETDRYVEFLRTVENYDPVWDVSDANWAIVKILERQGRTNECIPLVEKTFHSVLSGRRFDSLEAAEGVLDYLRGLDAPVAVTDPLSNRLAARVRTSTEVDSSASAENGAVRILFVGADDVKLRAQNQVREELLGVREKSTLEFYTTGWSGWSKALDDVSKKLRHVDGLVLSRFVRTEFGRQVRRRASESGLPWVSCVGRGVQTMTRSVLQASDWASP